MMKAKEWRAMTGFLVELIEHDVNFKVELPKMTDGMTISEYKYRCELARRCTAEAQVDAIKENIEWFKKAYLDRETCDDFDE